MGFEGCFDPRQHNYNIIMGVIVKVIVIAVICGISWQIDNGLALTPPLVFVQGGC